MIPRRTVPLVVATLAASLATIAHAFDPITWSSIDGGGVAHVSGGAYTLGATIGQHDAGTLAGSTYTLRGGFWTGGATGTVGVGDDRPVARVFRLFPPRPNPVRSTSRLAFDLPRASTVTLTIFDVSGRIVRRLDLGLMPAGHHEHVWGAVNDDGRAMKSGTYFLRVDAGSDRGARKVLVIR